MFLKVSWEGALTKLIMQTDTARCVGHARCAAVASEIVALDDNGMNVTAEREVPPEHEKLARRAARACPEGIVSIIEV